MGETLFLSDADFRERLAGASGVLMFYKKQCPYCKALEKMLEKFFAGKPEVQDVRIDSEESPEAMKTFGAERAPTLVVLRDGKVSAKKAGLMNLREMTDFYWSAVRV